MCTRQIEITKVPLWRWLKRIRSFVSQETLAAIYSSLIQYITYGLLLWSVGQLWQNPFRQVRKVIGVSEQDCKIDSSNRSYITHYVSSGSHKYPYPHSKHWVYKEKLQHWTGCTFGNRFDSCLFFFRMISMLLVWSPYVHMSVAYLMYRRKWRFSNERISHFHFFLLPHCRRHAVEGREQ